MVGEGLPGTNGLVDVEHVGVFIPAVGVQRWFGVTVDEVAWAILLEEADHA